MNSVESILTNLALFIFIANFYYWCVVEGMRDFRNVAYPYARGTMLFIAFLILIVIA